jgi:hypothetical protein
MVSDSFLGSRGKSLMSEETDSLQWLAELLGASPEGLTPEQIEKIEAETDEEKQSRFPSAPNFIRVETHDREFALRMRSLQNEVEEMSERLTTVGDLPHLVDLICSGSTALKMVLDKITEIASNHPSFKKSDSTVWVKVSRRALQLRDTESRPINVVHVPMTLDDDELSSEQEFFTLFQLSATNQSVFGFPPPRSYFSIFSNNDEFVAQLHLEFKRLNRRLNPVNDSSYSTKILIAAGDVVMLKAVLALIITAAQGRRVVDSKITMRIPTEMREDGVMVFVNQMHEILEVRIEDSYGEKETILS